MTDNTICCGACFINPQFDFPYWPTLPEPIVYQPMLPTYGTTWQFTSQSLDFNEQQILDLLKNAWNEYVKLNETNEDVIRDFRDAIHKCQYVIALRVAKRCNPEIWN